MCQSHTHSGSRRSHGGSAVAERPTTRNTPTTRASEEKPKPANTSPKAPPTVPGIRESNFPPVPREVTPTSTPKVITATPDAKTPANPAKTSFSDLLAMASLPKTSATPKPAINLQSAISSVPDLMSRNTVSAQTVIPEGFSNKASNYISTIESTLKLLVNYEQDRTFNSKDFNIYRNRSMYMLYMQCFPEEHVRYSNSTNFMTSIHRQEDKIIRRIYDKLIDISLATGKANTDKYNLPHWMGRALR